MEHIGLFFGSFNPIHIGHLAIANYIVEYSDIDQLWFIISPHNPLKNKVDLASEIHRKMMAEIAIDNDTRFKISDIEFDLPKPSYTTKTLSELKSKYPNKKFSIIMGEDNLATLHLWKDYEKIVSNHKIFCYPRAEKTEYAPLKNANIQLVDAPLLNISSTIIRDALKDNKNVKFFIPHRVYEYILDNGIYFSK